MRDARSLDEREKEFIVSSSVVRFFSGDSQIMRNCNIWKVLGLEYGGTHACKLFHIHQMSSLGSIYLHGSIQDW